MNLNKHTIINEFGKRVQVIGQLYSRSVLKEQYPDTMHALLLAVADKGYKQRSEEGNRMLIDLIDEEYYHVDPVDIPFLISAVWDYWEKGGLYHQRVV